MTRVIEIVAALIASLAFVFFVLRPLIGGLIRGGANAASAGATPAPPGGRRGRRRAARTRRRDDRCPTAPSTSREVEGRVRGSSVKKMAEVVNQHPDESVQIIRGWLNNAI